MAESTRKYPPKCPQCLGEAICFVRRGSYEPDTPLDTYTIQCPHCNFVQSHEETGGSYCSGTHPTYCQWCHGNNDEHESAPQKIHQVKAWRYDLILIEWTGPDGLVVRQSLRFDQLPLAHKPPVAQATTSA